MQLPIPLLFHCSITNLVTSCHATQPLESNQFMRYAFIAFLASSAKGTTFQHINLRNMQSNLKCLSTRLVLDDGKRQIPFPHLWKVDAIISDNPQSHKKTSPHFPCVHWLPNSILSLAVPNSNWDDDMIGEWFVQYLWCYVYFEGKRNLLYVRSLYLHIVMNVVF